MNQIEKVFQYQGNSVRTVSKDGEPWFVAKDVCDILEIANSRDAVARLEQDEKGVVLTDTPGGRQEVQAVNEPGLYTLILGSRKPEAKSFKRWITHEVIPTIRKTGGYVANEDLFINTYLQHADESTKLLFKSTLETIRKQNETISIMQPKADYFDALVDRNLLTNFRETAKELKVKESDFIAWLIDHKYVYRDQKGKLQPYAHYVPRLFEIKDKKSKNGKWAGTQTFITPKGKETFRLLLKEVKQNA